MNPSHITFFLLTTNGGSTEILSIRVSDIIILTLQLNSIQLNLEMDFDVEEVCVTDRRFCTHLWLIGSAIAVATCLFESLEVG